MSPDRKTAWCFRGEQQIGKKTFESETNMSLYDFKRGFKTKPVVKGKNGIRGEILSDGKSVIFRDKDGNVLSYKDLHDADIELFGRLEKMGYKQVLY